MRIPLWPLLFVWHAVCAQDFAIAPFEPAQLEALITDPSLDEISGIASSRRADHRYWVHDDSPRPAELQAIDEKGTSLARVRIEGVKAIDWARQAFGAMGLSQDTPLTWFYAYERHLRVADGPDEVHRNAIAKQELAAYL